MMNLSTLFSNFLNLKIAVIVSLVYLQVRDASALVTIDSLFLGENSQESKERDPLLYVFQKADQKRRKKKEDQKEGNEVQRLQFMLSLFREGPNLKNYCEGNPPELLYSSIDQKEQVMMSMMANLQYLMLDHSIRAIPIYAAELGFNLEQFKNLIRNIVGNFCSQNITVISIRQIAENLLYKFQNLKTNTQDFQLPSFQDTFYPKQMNMIVDKNISMERELLQTIKIFKSACSWGGRVEHPRLLVPLLNNHFIMSFLINHMSGLELSWDHRQGKIFLKIETEKKGRLIKNRVLCQNSICRPVPKEEYFNKIPKSIGHISWKDDFSRFYCETFQGMFSSFTEKNQQIKQWILKTSQEDGLLLVNQLWALITGMPDLLIRSEKFTDLWEYLKLPMIQVWDEWSDRTEKIYSEDLLYEESVSLEKVPREYYYDYKKGNFKIIFNLNLGEFDKMFWDQAKIKVELPLVFTQRYLRWIRNQWLHRDYRRTAKNQKMFSLFKNEISSQLKYFEKKFVVPPWKEGFEDLVAHEIFAQLEMVGPAFYQIWENREVKIPIVIQYGPFALRYMSYRFRVHRGDLEIDY